MEFVVAAVRGPVGAGDVVQRSQENDPSTSSSSEGGGAELGNRLDFDEIQQRPAIQKVRQRVQALTSKPVNFRDMPEWVRTGPSQDDVLCSPAMHPTDTCYDVYLNGTLWTEWTGKSEQTLYRRLA